MSLFFGGLLIGFVAGAGLVLTATPRGPRVTHGKGDQAGVVISDSGRPPVPGASRPFRTFFDEAR